MPQQGRKRHVSITDVAARAGVSITTVSHVLSGQRPVSAATTAKVQQVIAELGYAPNRLARGLRLRRSDTVALVIPDITNPFYPQIARGLQNALGPAGVQVLVTSTDADPAAEEAAVQQMITRRVDGPASPATRPTTAGSPPRPRSASRWSCSAAARDTPRHRRGQLRRRGRRRDSGRVPPGPRLHPRRVHHRRRARRRPANRVLGYRHALREAGMTFAPSLVVREEISRDGGARAMRQLLALRRPPDAVLCTNDMVGSRRPRRREGARAASTSGRGGDGLRRHRDRRADHAGADHGVDPAPGGRARRSGGCCWGGWTDRRPGEHSGSCSIQRWCTGIRRETCRPRADWSDDGAMPIRLLEREHDQEEQRRHQPGDHEQRHHRGDRYAECHDHATYRTYVFGAIGHAVRIPGTRRDKARALMLRVAPDRQLLPGTVFAGREQTSPRGGTQPPRDSPHRVDAGTRGVCAVNLCEIVAVFEDGAEAAI